MPCKGNYPLKYIRNHVTLKPADRVNIQEHVESNVTANQEVGPPDWNLGRDTNNTPKYKHHHITESGQILT